MNIPFHKQLLFGMGWVLALCLINPPAKAAGADTLYHVGVLAKRGPEHAREQWQASIDYLSEKLAPSRFVLVPLDFDALPQAVGRKQIDFLLTNPAIYIELEKAHRISRIATLVTRVTGEPCCAHYGGVAFVRAAQDGIRHLRDIAGHSLAAVDRTSLGGFQMLWRELHRQGLDPFRDSRELGFLETHDAVVRAVLDGRYEVGSVRTGQLESMAAEGLIRLDQVRVLEPLQNPQEQAYPFMVSTRLYPEWPLAKLQHVSMTLATRVASTLMSMPSNHPAALSGGYESWVVPLNYTPVDELLKELKLGPYAHAEPITLKDIWRQHSFFLLWALGTFGLLLLTTLYVSSLNRRLETSRQALQDSRDQLENRVKSRTAELAQVNDSLRQEIRERQQAEEEIQLNARVFETTAEGILITDENGLILTVNDAFVRLTGYTRQEVIGQNPKILQSGRHDEAFYQEMWQAIRSQGSWTGEIWNRRKNGELYPEWLTISRVNGHNGQATHHIAVFSDISQIKESEQRYEYLAHHDPLTHLPNRLLLSSRLEQAINSARRSQQQVAVLFIDLDHFKTINDSLGHESGDQLLIKVAERLKRVVRESDTVARLSGDEFCVVLEQIGNADAATMVAENIIDRLARPVRLPQSEAFVGASVGISLFPDDGNDWESLLKHADTAMYRAKSMGRNTFQFYTAELTVAANERFSIERQLRHALAHEELKLHFQPVFDLRQQRITSTEALLRWNNPELGPVSPARFIPIAEDTGLILSIGRWVLETACRQLQAWHEAGHDELSVTVNVSGRQLMEKDFEHQVADIIRDTCIDPRRLVLEMTESMLMQAGSEGTLRLKQLQRLGVKIAIDDFGTGYSSFAYLRQFAADYLKIDRSFVRDTPNDHQSCIVTEAIVMMGHALKMTLIAEGVETPEQEAFLRTVGCDKTQGYLFSPPASAEELTRMLAQQVRRKTEPRRVVSRGLDKLI